MIIQVAVPADRKSWPYLGEVPYNTDAPVEYKSHKGLLLFASLFSNLSAPAFPLCYAWNASNAGVLDPDSFTPYDNADVSAGPYEESHRQLLHPVYLWRRLGGRHLHLSPQPSTRLHSRQGGDCGTDLVAHDSLRSHVVAQCSLEQAEASGAAEADRGE